MRKQNHRRAVRARLTVEDLDFADPDTAVTNAGIQGNSLVGFRRKMMDRSSMKRHGSVVASGNAAVIDVARGLTQVVHRGSFQRANKNEQACFGRANWIHPSS